MKLRLGLVGLSSDWNQRHLPALHMLRERFEVLGVYSSVTSFAENAAREFGAVRYDGFREMLRHEDIDAALMLESDWYGTAPIRAACDFGRAIYCGSEIDILPAQAMELKQIVDESGIAFMAEFPRRFAPASLRLKELIATRLGRPRMIFCHRRLPPATATPHRNGRSPQARMDRELMELIDWCTFVVDRRVNTVQATSYRSAKDKPVCPTGPSGSPDERVPDYQALSLEFENSDEDHPKTIAQISCGSYFPAAWHEAVNFRPPAAMQVFCENGLAFLDLPNSLIWFDDAGRHQESLESELAVGQQLLTQFHRAVTSLVRKMGDLEDVYAGLRTLQTARESLQQARALPVSA